MPATGLKIVGTGACLQWRSISSFQNSLKTSGHRGYEFLEFWCWNLVTFLWYRFPAAEEIVVVFDVFFRLMMRQMFSIGERSGLQAGQFSTQTLLLRSHAVVIAAACGFALSCWNTQGLPWNRRRLEGSICCSKIVAYVALYIPLSIHSAFQNMQACPYRMHICILIPSEMLAFELNADNMQEGLPPL